MLRTICIGKNQRVYALNIRKITECALGSHPAVGQKRQLSHSCANQNQQKTLFTPGPLGISKRVKESMLRDVGSREKEFIDLLRKRLLEIALVSENEFTVVPMQGSGTFAIESALTTTIPRSGGKILIFENGAYGKRLADICRSFDVKVEVVTTPETEKVNVEEMRSRLGEGDFTHVAVTHCETSSGVINPVGEIGKIVKDLNSDTTLFVDAMSSFGGIPLDMRHVDVMVSSVNKCLQGVPGFGYVFVRKELLKKCKGNSRSVSLDLVSQCEGLDKNGQFRFTPPTHAMLAFKEALLEFEREGGIEQRASRYRKNSELLQEGMRKMGFQTLLDHSMHPESYIITSFHYPGDSKYNFEEFYARLYEMDQVIYPGKVTTADCFRIGTIGDIWPRDIRKLLRSIEEVLIDMRIQLPLT